MMAIRVALITCFCWLVAFAALTWGEVRVMRAQQAADMATLKYTEALIHKRTVEAEELNRALDKHIQVLESSYPRILQASN